MSKKNKILLILITFLISIIIYINFVTGYYSVDSKKIMELGYEGYGTQYSLYDGRIFMFMICNIAEIINISIKNLYIILLTLSLFISSITVLIIYEIAIDLKPTNNIFIKILLYLISYNFIFNFMYINNMQFMECFIMAVSILLFIIASKKIVIENKKFLGLLICILAVLFYQGTINIFITASVLFLLLKKNEYRSNSKILKELIIIGIVTIITILFDLVAVEIAHNYVASKQKDRLTLDIIKNVMIMIKNFPVLINDSLELFPQFLQITTVITILVFMYFYSIKNNKIKEFWFLILLVWVSYFSCLAMGLTYGSLIFELNGRVFASIGALISCMLIFMYVNTNIFNSKITGNLIKIFIIIYFIINAINVLYITKMLKDGNGIDRQVSFKIQAELEKNNINEFAIYYTFDEKGNKIPFTASDIADCTYNECTYKLYTGKEIVKVFFDKEEIRKNPDKEKMIVIDDVLYVIIDVCNYMH